jgi:hypothetical protein
MVDFKQIHEGEVLACFLPKADEDNAKNHDSKGDQAADLFVSLHPGWYVNEITHHCSQRWRRMNGLGLCLIPSLIWRNSD